MTFSLKI